MIALQLDSTTTRRLYRRPTYLQYVRLLLAPAALLLSSLACSGSGGWEPAPLWRYSVPDAWRDSPTYIHVVEEQVYLAPKLPPVYDRATLLTNPPETHVLTALELATGKRIWEQQIDIKFASEWLADAGRIFYIPPLQLPGGGEPAQSIVALDAATGTPLWRFDAMQVDDTLLLRGGCLFIFDTHSKLLCLDVDDGSVQSSYPGVPVAELGVDGAGAVQTRITDTAFHQLSPAGVLRTYAIPKPTLVYSVPLAFEGVPDALNIVDGHAFIRTQLGETMNPRLYVFALPTGQLLWDAPDTGRLAQVFNHGGRQYALVFKPNDNGVQPGILVFDLTTGEKLHAVDALNREFWVSPSGRLITYTGAGQIVAHDLVTGVRLWSAKSDSNGVVEIGGQGDAVYLVASNTPPMSVTDDVNRLEVFDVQSGELLWRIKEGFEVQVVPDAPYLLAGDAGRLALYSFSR